MPEGDTIRRLADSLTAKFAGGTVESATFRHPRLATIDLDGTRLLEADAFGKHLFLRFSHGYSIHVHLRMSGSVYHRAVPEVSSARRKFEIRLDRGSITAVDIPVLEYLRTNRERHITARLGTDVCGAYDGVTATKRFLTAGDMPVTQAMLDQRFVAGFGNIYAVETPFIVGVNPYSPVNQLSNASALLAVGVGLIRTNARYGPQNTTSRNLSRTEHWVLSERSFQCRICGDRLVRISGRNSPWQRRHAWCPNCQPEGKTDVDLTRAAKLLALHPCRELVDLVNGRLLSDVSHPVRTEYLRAMPDGGRSKG